MGSREGGLSQKFQDSYLIKQLGEWLYFSVRAQDGRLVWEEVVIVHL